jgi:hypothetical protein
MNAERVPFEALKERSRVCFGGFRPLKHVEGSRLRAVTHFGVQARALARGAPHFVFGGEYRGEYRMIRTLKASRFGRDSAGWGEFRSRFSVGCRVSWPTES